MTAQIERVFPNQVMISWTAVVGTRHYDVYVDKKPIARLDGDRSSCVVGGNDDPLLSNHRYQIIVASRDGDDRTIDFTQVVAETVSWSGSYRWTNSTDNDNKGRCVSLRYVVDDVPGRQMVIKSELPGLGLQVVSPAEIIGSWTDYNDPSAAVYRANGLMFNASSAKPSKFLVDSVTQTAKGILVEVKSKALGMTFTTHSYYQFVVTEDGKRACVFWTTGNGLASTGIFKNPERGSEGKFVLVEE
jgi:hypothetical protein